MKDDTKAREVVRISLDELEQEKAAFLAEKFRMKRLPALFRHLLNAAYDEERKADRTYRAGASTRAVSRETRDETVRKIRKMGIVELNTFLGPGPEGVGYFKEETPTGVGDVVERERMILSEATNEPVLATQHFSVGEGTISYEATTLNLDQVIAELIKQKLI